MQKWTTKNRYRCNQKKYWKTKKWGANNPQISAVVQKNLREVTGLLQTPNQLLNIENYKKIRKKWEKWGPLQKNFSQI